MSGRLPLLRRASRTQLIELIQRRLAPFSSSAALEQALKVAEAGDFPQPGQGEVEGYDPVVSLHHLASCFPDFFESGELRVLDDEATQLGAIQGQRLDPSRTYRVKQTVSVRPDALRSDSGLSLWVPVPRHVPGFQEVSLTELSPPAFRRFYLPEAGLLYAVPWLCRSGVVVPSSLEMHFVVQQDVSRLSSWNDAPLAPTDAPGSTGVRGWLETAGLGGDIAAGDVASQRVQQIVDAMEADFEATVHGAFSCEALIAMKLGNGETLSQFLVTALREVGLAAQLASGQRLYLQGGEAQLCFPGSLAYEHRFVRWTHPASSIGGIVDLSYFQRWGFWATDRNTSSDAVRERMRVHGNAYRHWLREHLYPLDFLLAGLAPKARYRDLGDAAIEGVLEDAVDTRLAVQRCGGAP